MKLTNKEMIRLKKETHLLEHGFYDEEVRKNIDMQETTLFIRTRDCGLDDWRILARMDWFKKKFPEFFEDGANK